MTPQSPVFLTLRGALAGLALACILFLGMVAGLHVHEGHEAGECDICLQIHHLGIEIVSLDSPDGIQGAVALPTPSTDHVPTGPVLGGDPARAPPCLS